VPSILIRNSENRSAFQRALDQYILGLSEKRKKDKFIIACISRGDTITTENINGYIKRAEDKMASKRSRIEKILTPVVNVLKDYDVVINSLSQSWSVSLSENCSTFVHASF